MHLTLKQIFPEMTKDQRDRLGFELHCYGVKRIGPKVQEGDYMVNVYNVQDHNFIVKFAIKLLTK